MLSLKDILRLSCDIHNSLFSLFFIYFSQPILRSQRLTKKQRKRSRSSAIASHQHCRCNSSSLLVLCHCPTSKAHCWQRNIFINGFISISKIFSTNWSEILSTYWDLQWFLFLRERHTKIFLNSIYCYW